MTDRNVQHPKRYQMVPVQGTTDIVDLTPAPGEIYAEGTLINKATLLKDATAALFGLGTDAVPDDVFAWLGKYNQYWWRRKKETVSYEILLDNKANTFIFKNTNPIAVSDINTFSNVSAGPLGEIQTSGKAAYSISAGSANEYAILNTLGGRYFYPVYQGVEQTTLYRMSEGSVATSKSEDGVTSISVLAQRVYVKTITAGEWFYLYSSNRSAYPDSGEQDGYEYEYLGIPFENAVGAPKIETGSYVGTGTAGGGTPNTLTFNFTPKLVCISSDGYNQSVSTQFISPRTNGYSLNGNGVKMLSVSWSGNSVSWYSSANQALEQMNSSGITYGYIAIG